MGEALGGGKSSGLLSKSSLLSVKLFSCGSRPFSQVTLAFMCYAAFSALLGPSLPLSNLPILHFAPRSPEGWHFICCVGAYYRRRP